MKRVFDFILTLFCLVLLSVPILITALLVKFTSPGPVLYWSDRVGLNNELFKMPKFRSMKIDTPEVATHLLADPKSALTPIGNFLRKTSLDELAISEKVKLDVEYMQHQSFTADLHILCLTFFRVISRHGVKH